MTYKGVVDWFNDRKGFGFIADESGRDIYVHYAEIIRDGFKTLEVGEKVVFEVIDEDCAPKAVSVRIREY